MKVFAPSAFRWPVGTGQDYPFGLQDIGNDTLARALLSAGVVVADDPGDQINAGDKPFSQFNTAQVLALNALVSGAGVPRILAQSGMPMILPGNGSIGNNGALTLGTALTPTYSYPLSTFAYFKASAIFAGSVAGLYYTVLSSETAGTIYQNIYAGGAPVIPGTPLAWVCTGPGAYSQTLNVDISIVSTVVPGGSMGVNGSVRTSATISSTNNANSKTVYHQFGSAYVQGVNLASTPYTAFLSYVRNRGVANRQVALNGNFGDVASGGEIKAPTVNTLVDQLSVISLNLAVGTDNAVIEGFTQELLFM
jgi:hypothetical protein